MDKLLDEAAKKLSAETIFEIVRNNYCETSKAYLEKQVQIASDYLTDQQKAELRRKGISV